MSSVPRCVALCPRAGGVGGKAPVAGLPAELEALLGQRSAKVACFDSALAALAELVVLERSLGAGGHRDPTLLILVEPARLRDAEALVAAASKYAHHAAVWQYEAASEKRLSRYAAPVGLSGTAPTPKPANGNPGASVGNGTGAGSGGARANVNGAGGSGGPGGPGGPAAPRSTLGASGGSFVSWGGMPGNMVMMPGPARGSVAGAPAGGSTVGSTVGASGGPSGGPKLRLAGAGVGVPVSGPAPAPAAAPQTAKDLPAAAVPKPAGLKPELSDEEIAMLLDSPRAGSPAPGPGAAPPRNTP